MQQQNAAIPERRLVPPEIAKVVVDTGALPVSEGPKPRLECKLQPLNWNNNSFFHHQTKALSSECSQG
jgi:hypothetical protein